MELLNKAKLETAITFEDENEKHSFVEGDFVIVIENDHQYEGKISCIGTYQNEDEEFAAFYLDVSKDKFDYSYRLIKVDDITYICKTPVNDLVELDQEQIEKKMFKSMLQELGCKAKDEKYDDIYNDLKNISEFFDVPFSKVETSFVYSYKVGCKPSEALAKYCGIDINWLEDFLNESNIILTEQTKEIKDTFGTILTGGLVLGLVGISMLFNPETD